MRMTKKITSIVLAVMMVVSMMSVMAVTANATGEFVPESDYLTFTAEEANSSVTLEYRSCDYLQYNKNNSGWQDYTYGAQITLNNVGDYVRFRGSGTSFNDYHHVSLTGKVAASGNVMSLRLDNNGKSQGLSNSCFQYMFDYCDGLTTAPELPETLLARNCYFSMFRKCTSLTKAPVLPATSLEYGCYRYMFRDCDGLTELPALPATTLADYCYAYMFYDCENIRISDEAGTFGGITYSAEYRIPSTGTGTSAEKALDDMFGVTGGKFADTPDINTTYYLPAPAPSTYTVTWNNWDDTELDTDEVEEGDTPSYTGAEPTKTDDSNNIYTFSGWTPEITAVTGDVTYTATFTSTPAVAKIGSTKYETFADAVAGRASNDDVIELLAAAGSYTMTADQSIKVIKNSKSLTLNAPAGAYAVAYTYNSTTKVYTYTVVEAVASATKNDTTTYYASANDALKNAATGSTITLLKDSTESAVSVGSKLSGKTYTIDLNDKTLTLNGSGNALFNIASPSNLTIQNGKIVFNGTGTNQNGILLNDVYNNAVLTIEDDVVIEAKGTCSAVTVTGGTLNTEGALSSEDAPAIDTTNNSMGQGYTINVTGGSVTTTGDTAICQRVATGELNITGGNISGDTAAVQAINNTDDTVTISGGTFNTPVPEEYCADGYIPKDNGNNTYGVKVGSYVAQVGSTKYESLQDALDVTPDGGTVTVLKDIATSGNIFADGYVSGGNRTYTVDLGGYTVSGGTFVVSDGNDVTFKNGTIESASYAIQNTATATVDSTATVKSTATNASAVYGVAGSTTNINGTVEGNKYGVIVRGGTLNVAGEVTAVNTGIDAIDGGVANINDGADVSGKFAIVAHKDSTVNVNGGNVEGTSHAVSGNGKAADGGYTINVTGGTLTATDGAAIYNPNATGTMIISGGTITGSTSAVTAGENSTNSISGGTFNKPVPDEYCAPGFVPKDNGNGTYGVQLDNSNPLNPFEKAAADINDGNLFGINCDYLAGTLLGVQKKTVAGEGTSSQEGAKNMRFVAVLDTDLVQDADDYGFVLAKVTDTTAKTFGYDNTNFDNLKANMGNGEKTISAKGTYNNVCGNEAYGNPSDTSTDYKYITCAVNNVTDDDKVIARFYYKKDGKTYYAKYAGHNYKYTGCIAAWSDLP